MRAWKLLLVGRLLVVVARRFWSGLVLGGGRSAQSHTPIEGSSKLETPVVCGCRRVALKLKFHSTLTLTLTFRKFIGKEFRNHKATTCKKKKVSKNQMQCTRPTSSLLSLASQRARLAFRVLEQKIVQDATLTLTLTNFGFLSQPTELGHRQP
jgi:hypothetical protein